MKRKSILKTIIKIVYGFFKIKDMITDSSTMDNLVKNMKNQVQLL